MTHTSWNMSGNDPASSDVRRLSAFLLLALIALIWCAPLRAADQPKGPFLVTSSTRTTRDVEIEIKIFRALRKDAQLKPLSLGVHMVGGVVKLSGPVPSAELKKRVVAIAARVEGVLQVNARDLYISSAAQGSKQMTVIIPEDQPTQTRSASPRLPSSGPEPLSRESGSGIPVEKITLLAPEVAPHPPRVPEPARLTTNPRPVSLVHSIPPAVEQLRRRDKRFQSIRTQVRGTTVCIFPSDAPGEDAMLFAQAVRRLSGVQHVIVASGSR